MAKKTKEAWKTYGNVFDQYTINNLQKLTTQGYFEELTNTLSPGKEANVFAAEKLDGTKVIVKIYRLENCNFNKMFEYISQDPRYAYLKGKKRKIIFAWTQREYRNLIKAREIIRVPTVYTFKDNIVVMEYIDEDNMPALQLKNADLKNPRETFDEILDFVKKLYANGLVHGDLSEFNILMQNNKVVFIDFSQTTASNALNARELLRRDLYNVFNFFTRKKVALPDIEETYEAIIAVDKKL